MKADKKAKPGELPAEPRGGRTPYKYGGSLGWIASMIDPETSSWKRPPRPKPQPKRADVDNLKTNDDS